MTHALIEIPLDDGALDALVACPETPGRHAPILLLGDAGEGDSTRRRRARRLSAHSFFVLAPDVSGRRADDLREAASAALDHLADQRDCDDARVGVLGFGVGADLALELAARRAERVAAVAAYGGRGFGPCAAFEIASRINGFVRIGYRVGHVPRGVGLLETALTVAGVLFDTDIYETEPWSTELADLFGRTLAPPPPVTGLHGAPQGKGGSPPLNHTGRIAAGARQTPR
ncbi:MAG: dienelactone hydrolase family protein [Phenylobacterium sp.]|uniref:dienelactone hydrolase family protein n=1 Tax=Phenylobacterium sp. TaxID=1871053 RepID=UPI001A5AD717|nr:dienelactone hydrolase family protein [Phenylobacterium sp.]MBL8556385.1 dienelactone hydrolase family protein [Phenylobacterium sp.]